MSASHKHGRKDTVIQFHVSAADKSSVQQAPELRCLEMSVYTKSLLGEATKKELQEASQGNRLLLNSKEWDNFMHIMNSPATINKILKKAFTDFKKKYGYYYMHLEISSLSENDVIMDFDCGAPSLNEYLAT